MNAAYDSTNKNCQAGDIDIVEFGAAKVDAGLPIFNYAVGYDVNNREPLMYEKYSGSDPGTGKDRDDMPAG